MRIRTTWILPAPPGEVWPLLCGSRMDVRRPCLFRLGVPKPVECRLPGGEGAVGRERECVSDQGIVHQRITQWEPPSTLRFEMVDTALYFRPCVSSLREGFELVPMPGGRTRITRSTDLEIRGAFGLAKGLLLWAGLKQVHRYVFGNWEAQLS